MNKKKRHDTRFAGSAALPRLMRLPQVLEQIPVSKSAWWTGVKEGKYPAAHKLGPRTTVWLGQNIERLIATLRKGSHD